MLIVIRHHIENNIDEVYLVLENTFKELFKCFHDN